MHPLLQDLLVGVARAGTKAVVSALDSVLEDVDANVLEEASRRVKKARKRAKRIVAKE
jgi:hypothetical protein